MALSNEAFMELLEKHRHEFYRYIMRNVWNPSVAEDVFSSGIMTAYEQREKFKEGTNFRAWVFKILTNKCYVANRETKRSAIDVEQIDESHFANYDEHMHQAWEDPYWFLEQMGDELYAAMRKLGTAERSCLLLLSVEKYSYKEIASTLDMPVGTVMTHLARGRAKLRRLLLDHALAEGIIGDDKHQELAAKHAAKDRKKSAS